MLSSVQSAEDTVLTFLLLINLQVKKDTSDISCTNDRSRTCVAFKTQKKEMVQCLNLSLIFACFALK